MRAGLLRHRVTIEEKSVTRSATGAEDITWSTVATVWAEVHPLRGREFLEAKGLQEETSTRIRIRHRDGLDPSMRVTWGSHTYDIQAVIPIREESREIELMCREIV
jgi:SPP1 family predicted phage head-tail adaptor